MKFTCPLISLYIAIHPPLSYTAARVVHMRLSAALWDPIEAQPLHLLNLDRKDIISLLYKVSKLFYLGISERLASSSVASTG